MRVCVLSRPIGNALLRLFFPVQSPQIKEKYYLCLQPPHLIMKYFFAFLFIVVCTLSCRNKNPELPPHLSAVLQKVEKDEMLLTEACAYFEQACADTASMDETQKMYCKLKHVYLQYKSGKLPTPLEDALSIADYYKRKGPDSLYVESCYYVAGGYIEKGDYPEALEWYSKALTLCDNDSTLQNSVLYSKLCYHTGRLYNALFQPQKALEILRKALRGTENQLTPSILDGMGLAFHNMERDDSAAYYMNKAFECKCFAYEGARRRLGYSQLPTFYILKDSDAITKRVMGLKEFDHTTRGNQFRGNYAYDKAIWYQYQNKTDSAVYYYKDAIAYGNFNKKENACLQLMNLYIKQNNLKEAVAYAQEFARWGDSVYKTTEIAQTLQTEKFLAYNENKQKFHELEQSKMHWMVYFISISFCLLLVVIASALVVYRKIKMAKNQRKAFEQQENAYLLQLEEEQRQLDVLRQIATSKDNARNVLKDEMEMRDRKLAETTNKLKTIEEEYYRLAKPNDRLSEKIMQHNGLLTDALWNEVLSSVNAKYPHLATNLENHSTNLSEIQLKILYLLCLNIPNYRIAFLLNISQQNLYGHKQRIYQRITGNKPDKPQDVNALIAALKSKKKRFGNRNNP